MKYAYILGATVLFAACLFWLAIEYSRGQQTYQWQPVRGAVTDVKAIQYPGSTEPYGWETTVVYHVDGVQYKSELDEYLIGDDVVVFVNPQDHTDVVGKAGPAVQNMFYPILATTFSGLLAIVMALIAFSPK